MFKVLKDAVYHNYGFWICLIVSIFLFIGSALVPPYFVIDSSIFVAVGELMGFTALGALYKALDNNKKATFKRGDLEVTVGDDKEEEAE